MKIFRASYDPHLCCSLADEYQNGSKGDRSLLDELLHQIAPLIGMVACMEVQSDNLDGGSLEELQCDALVKAYEMFEDQGVPTDCERTFTAFMYTSIKRALIDSIRTHSCRKIEVCDVRFETLTARMPSYMDVERRIQVFQVIETIHAMVRHDCRFTGKEQAACYYMAKCELGHLNADPMTAQHRFSLSRKRATQLAKHTRVLVKSSLYFYKDADADT